MALSNVELFQGALDAFHEGDLERVLSFYSEDIVVLAARSAVEGPYLGHDGVRKFFADTAESFEVFEPKPTELRDVGERLLVIGTIRVRTREGDIETEVPMAGVVSFKEGKIVRWEDFRERRLALQALGLES